jgi:hypothetical protein
MQWATEVMFVGPPTRGRRAAAVVAGVCGVCMR